MTEINWWKWGMIILIISTISFFGGVSLICSTIWPIIIGCGTLLPIEIVGYYTDGFFPYGPG